MIDIIISIFCLTKSIYSFLSYFNYIDSRIIGSAAEDL